MAKVSSLIKRLENPETEHEAKRRLIGIADTADRETMSVMVGALIRVATRTTAGDAVQAILLHVGKKRPKTVSSRLLMASKDEEKADFCKRLVVEIGCSRQNEVEKLLRAWIDRDHFDRSAIISWILSEIGVRSVIRELRTARERPDTGTRRPVRAATPYR